MSGLSQLLTWAAHQVGTKEDPIGSNMQPYAAIAGQANGQPWCATFLIAAWKANDIPMVDGSSSAFTPTMHDSFKNGGRLFQHPRAGDAGFKFIESEGRIGHVFLVEKVLGDTVQTIEGNSNNDGSATGIGVFRLSRRWQGDGTIKGFGRQRYVQANPGPMPTVSLKDIIFSAKHDPPAEQGATSHPEEVKIVEAALMAEGLLSQQFAKDGSFGIVTVTAYSQWQKRQGFTGQDANGVPGLTTLRALGQLHGFKVND